MARPRSDRPFRELRREKLTKLQNTNSGLNKRIAKATGLFPEDKLVMFFLSAQKRSTLNQIIDYLVSVHELTLGEIYQSLNRLNGKGLIRIQNFSKTSLATNFNIIAEFTFSDDWVLKI